MSSQPRPDQPTLSQRLVDNRDKGAEIVVDLTEVTLAPADLLLGIKYTFCSNQRVVAEMLITKHHTQPMGILHGGITCVLAESVGSVASNLANFNDPGATAMVGSSIVANHLRPAMLGDTIEAVATPIHVGKSSHLWEIKISSKSGFLICVARLSTHIMKLDLNKHKAFLEAVTAPEKNVSLETAQGNLDLHPQTPLATPDYPALPNGHARVPASL